MLYTKYESSGPCSFRQEDFGKLHFKNLCFDPVTYLCNQSEPFKPLVEDYPRTIPVEFGQIPISGSRQEVILSFPYIIQCKIVTHGAGSILTPGA